MPTSAEALLFDTSAALALVVPSNPFHAWVNDLAGKRKRGLAGHARFELYSVLTRLPGTGRLSPADAARLIGHEFPDSRFLSPKDQNSLLDELARLGIQGGAVYDALIAACARAHHLPLITCDLRARATYRLLQTPDLAPDPLAAPSQHRTPSGHGGQSL